MSSVGAMNGEAACWPVLAASAGAKVDCAQSVRWGSGARPRCPLSRFIELIHSPIRGSLAPMS
jgi:hypothetical protein